MIESVDIKAEILPNYQIFDVRSKSEWKETGIIKDAILLSLNNENGSPNPNFLDEFKNLAKTDKPIALVCRSGQRSSFAANIVKAKLRINVTNLRGGMMRLIAQGYKTISYKENK